MADTNKKSLSYKLQKNPVLLVFIIVALAVALFGVVNITAAIKEKMDLKTETTTLPETTTQAAVSETVQPEPVKKVNLYSKNIVSYKLEKTENNVSVIAEFADKQSLLTTHNADDANNADSIPVFCFYASDGTQLNCPGELKLNTNNNTAVYTLSVINDFANAVALTDEITVTYDNILDLPFDICLQSKSSGDLGSTIMGTHTKNDGAIQPDCNLDLINKAQGVKKAELTKTDEFIWLDIYFDDVNAYTQLNNDFITNFVSFGFDCNGVKVKRDFIVTEYDSLNMVRCKFDTYSMVTVCDEVNDSDLTVNDVFSDYAVSVWTSDYDKEQALFSINGAASYATETESTEN
ncbi:MAG: hypothetical protein IJ025_06690 [Clostridia bacterium]|nr:hypothetical protein [Clostridia bacterium]